MRRMGCLLLAAMTLSGAALADPPPVPRGDVEKRAEAMFDRSDTDHDGWLTRAEYHAALEKIVRAKGGTPTAKGWAAVDAQFDAVDQAHAGRIARAAFIAAATAHFDGADLNQDGTVTPDEARRAAKIKNQAMKAMEKAKKQPPR